MITLYKMSVLGNLMVWEISKIKDDIIKIEWGASGGTMQTQTEAVVTNQSNRNLAEQVCLRIDSRVNRQLDKGYKHTVDEARAEPNTNASGLPKPMLAQVYRGDEKTNKMMYQYKYNGHRCLVANIDGELIAYSRNGKPILTVNHILEGIRIPEGTVLDGELYIHGMQLQSISSIVRRVQPDNAKLIYVVYDHMAKQVFSDRLDRLHKWDFGPHSMIAPTTWNIPKEYLSNEGIEQQAINKGYEGFILRSDNTWYEPGKRSKQLLKVKRRLDGEYLVVNIDESKDGWAILICRCIDAFGSERTFRCVAPGDIIQKTNILRNSEKYIGKYVNVEYAEFTKDKIPFHPVAMYFREEE